jgi:ribosomal protein L37E
MYTVFICRKCDHNLYAEETPDFGEKLGKIAVMDCPNCGEEGYDNWILSCRKREFSEEKNKQGHWVYWDGWKGNHDYRIDDATCSKCGYLHPIVRMNGLETPKLLSTKCPS